MKKYIIVFIAGLLLGTGSYWTLRDGPLATKVRESSLVQKVSDKIDERVTSRLKEEMEKQGKIVMNKPAGILVPRLDDGRLGDLVKAKIAADPMLSEASIKPDVKDGEVNLQGTAGSYEDIGRAMRLALECEATKTVVSTIKIKSK